MFGFLVDHQHRCDLILAEYSSATSLFQYFGCKFIVFTDHRATTIEFQSHSWNTSQTNLFKRKAGVRAERLKDIWALAVSGVIRFSDIFMVKYSFLQLNGKMVCVCVSASHLNKRSLVYCISVMC